MTQIAKDLKGVFSINIRRYRVLVFCDYFWPGYRAGGPITTLKSTLSQLQDYYVFSTVTRNHDYQNGDTYQDIEPGGWTQTPYGEVYYASDSVPWVGKLRGIFKNAAPDIVYINSLFSVPYSFSILLFVKYLLGSNVKVVLCPRGELNPSALHYNRWRKMIFLSLFRYLGLHKFIFWQATNSRELAQIKKTFGVAARAHLAPNLTWGVRDTVSFPELGKPTKFLKVIFVARINDLKNLFMLLTVLSKRRWRVQLDIAGPVDEEEYWEDCQKLIAEIDNAIIINYLGEIENSKILDTIPDYHCLCLPTRGENFGQIIYEALSVGRPVIISDQTPWVNLESLKAGFDVDITSDHGLDRALKIMYHFDEEQWLDFCKGALTLATAYYGSSKADTVELFQHATNV